ncbi:MAG TPA: flippase activity-associated protein Agl23 [Verrucomicrobiae bacterium]|nr:flippase activity-associated protein Agl23 [Verrucomicrobiae bacterium]
MSHTESISLPARGKALLESLKKVDWLRVFILALSFLSLFLFLDWKPPQHDEGVNGWMIQDLLAKGYYPYDPANYHGPLHFYVLFVFRLFLGDNLWALRLPAVIFAWASIYLLTELKPYLGKFCAYAAALFVSVSPGMMFYSRYAIHESTLLFFSILTLLGFFRFWDRKDVKSLWLLGAGFTGMIVTKETYVLAVLSFVGAWMLTLLYEKFLPSTEVPPRVPASFSLRDIGRVTGTCAFVIVLLYSGFFLNWSGVLGLFTTFFKWLNTGALSTSEQKGHWKAVMYWIQLFLRYEWPASLGILMSFPLLGPAPRWHRVMMLYALLLLAAYSMIPYKTPWCILQIIWPFLVVAASVLGLFASRGGREKAAALIVMGLLSVTSLCKSVSLNFFHYADDQEPYVHVQTFESLMSVDRKIKALVARDPTKRHMTIHVVKKAYWPISWLLVDFTHHYYYTEELPPKADAGVIFCDVERKTRLEMRLKRPYFVERFRLNPAQDPGYVYYDKELFKDLFGPGAEVFEPETLPEAKPGEGLLARYYNNSLWQGDPVLEKVAGTPDFSWDMKETPLPAPFSVMFEGEIFVPESGDVGFYLASDDGSDLTLDNEILINNLGDHSEKTKEGTKKMEKGWHPIRVRFYDVGGSASLWLWWKLPSGREGKISPEHFRTSQSSEKR